MNTNGKQRGEKVIRKVVSAGSTNLSGGLFRSVQQIQDSLEEDDHGNPGTLKRTSQCQDIDSASVSCAQIKNQSNVSKFQFLPGEDVSFLEEWFVS